MTVLTTSEALSLLTWSGLLSVKGEVPFLIALPKWLLSSFALPPGMLRAPPLRPPGPGEPPG